MGKKRKAVIQKVHMDPEQLAEAKKRERLFQKGWRWYDDGLWRLLLLHVSA